MSSQHEPQKTEPAKPASSGPPSAAPVGKSSVKAGLRGHGFEAQEAMLSPAGADGGAPPADPVGAGSSGPPADLPYRAELEASFGQDLGHIKVFLGQPGPLLAIGARALTRGTTVVFAESTPDKKLVAEEVAHVLQNAKGKGAKPYSTNADGSEKRAKEAAATAASGDKVDVDAVGTADADVQAGWLGNAFNAIGGYVSSAATYVKETFTGGSTNTNVKPDQWRDKQHGFMKQFGNPAVAEDDVLCKPTLVTDKWYGSYFVYYKEAYVAGLTAWNVSVAAVKGDVKSLLPVAVPGQEADKPKGGAAPKEPDGTMPGWPEFAPAKKRDGIAVLKEDEFITLGKAMDESRNALKGEVVGILDAAKAANESAVSAITKLKELLKALRAAPKEVDGAPVSHIPSDNERRLRAFYSFYSATGEEVPEIYSHPLMAGNPAAVLALADLLDPISDLKTALQTHAADRPRCISIITSWARKHPDLGAQALSDPTIEQLIYTAGGATTAGGVTAAVGGGIAAGGVAALNPLAALTGVGMVGIGEGLTDQMATVDPDTLRMVKLLQNGGHLEGSDVESTAREALVSGDSDAFLRAWGQIVHQKAVFERLTTDDRFRKDVREKVPDAWDSFLSTIKAGAIDSNVSKKLTEPEKKLVEQYSNATIREMADAFACYIVRDASIVNPLQGWNRQLSNALATDTELGASGAAWEAKLREARFILGALFEARQGKTLESEIRRGLSEPSLTTALTLIGHMGDMQATTIEGFGDAGTIDTTGKTTIAAYGEELSDADKNVLKYRCLLKYSGQLYQEFERYSMINSLTDGGTRGAEVIRIIQEARVDARQLLAPAELDKYPALQKPFSKKVTQSMVYLAEVYNDAYEAEGEGKGSLRLRMSRELSQGHQQRALQLIGAMPAPTQHLVDAAMAQMDKDGKAATINGAKANVQSGAVETGLDALQQHASTHALRVWQHLKFTTTPKAVAELAASYTETMPTETKSALNLRPALKTMPMQMLEAAYRVLGGSLGGHIVEVFKADPTGAQTALDAFALGSVGQYAVAEDAELMAVLAKIDEDDAALAAKKGQKGANPQKLAASEQKNAEIRAQVQGQIPARQQLAWLSGQVFKHLESAPVKQDEVTRLVGEMSKVSGHADAPIEAIGPNQAVDGAPSVQILKDQRLDVYVYKQYQGIGIGQHLGRKLDDAHRDTAAKALGIAIEKTGAAKGDASILDSAGGLDKLGDALKIDETRVHGNIASKDSWEKNESFMTQAAAIVKRLDQCLVTLEKMATAAPSKLGIAVSGGLSLMASNSGFQDAKRALLIEVGSIGTGEERRVVDALFEKAYGVSLKFRLNKVSMVAGDENVEQMRRLAEGRLTAVDHLRSMVEAGDKDEVYRQVFKASPEMRKNILRDDHLLRLLATRFDSEFLQNIMRVCEGTQQVADLLHGRDADAGGKSAFWSWVATMGWSTDEAGMKSDLQLHLGALKDKITQANSTHVIMKGECLWSITEHIVGDPLRWKELYAENKTVVGKNPNLIYARVTLKLPAAWIADGSAKALAKEYLRIVLDPDVRSILGEQLSAKDRFEMESIITGGGSVSAGNQATIELNAANGDAFVASLKKMPDAERKALLKDASFVALMGSKLDGAVYQQAMSILATGTAYDKLSDLLGALSGNDFGIIDTIDEDKIFSALAAMGPDELARLKNSPVLAARVQGFLDKRPDEGGAFTQYIDTAAAKPDANATPDERRTAEITRTRDHLMAKYEIQLVRANAADRDKLYAVAIDVFKEKGEVEVPVAGSPVPKPGKKGTPAPPTPTEKVFVFKQPERDTLWSRVSVAVRKKHSVELATMVENAVTGTKDPSTDRVAFALTSTLGFGKDVEGAQTAIAAAADITVAREWSNIVTADANGLTLKDFYDAFAFARNEVGVIDKKLAATKAKSARADLQATREKALGEYYRRFTEFKGFRLDLNQKIRQVLAKQKDPKAVTTVGEAAAYLNDKTYGWLNTVGAKDQLALREAVRGRIAGLPKEVVGQAIGIVNEDGKLLENGKDVAKPAKEGEAATTSSVTLSGKASGQDRGEGTEVEVGLADLDLLMSDDRKARMGDVSAKEKYDHTNGDGFIGKSLGASDLNKSALNVASYNAMLDQAEERKAGEKVSTIDADESAELKVKLAAVNRSLADYSATKSFYSEIIKGIVVAVIAAVSTAMTGGAAGPLWATMLTAAVSAGAKVAIDELILGNDYEALADGIPMIIGDTLKAGLEQSLAAGVKSLAAQKNVFSKGLAFKLETQESLKAYLKTAGPLKGAMTEALMGGFGVVTDPWLDPVTRYLKPETWGEVYKHGLQSSWQTGMNTLDKKVKAMPKTFVSTIATTFLTKSATRGAESVFGAIVKPKDAEKGLPGLNIDPVRPKEPGRWESVSKALMENFSRENGGGTKPLYTFLAEQLVKEGILSLKDGHSFGDSWTEEGLKALVLEFGTQRVKGLIKSVGSGYGAYKKTTTALKRVNEESGNLVALAAKHQLDPEKMKDMYYQFITSGIGSETTGKLADLKQEANNLGGYSRVSADEFEKFFLARRIEVFETQKRAYAEECKAQNKPMHPSVVEDYKTWLFADPKAAEKRAKTPIATYVTNTKTLRAAGYDKHLTSDLTEDEFQMLCAWSEDAANLGDVAKGAFNDKVEFKKAYLVTKQTAAMLNLGTALTDKGDKGEFKAWLTTQDKDFWNEPMLQFNLKDGDIDQKVAVMVALYKMEKADGGAKSKTKTTPP